MTNSDLTKMVLSEVHVALKAIGFRKTGATFTRDLGDVVQLVNVQKSSLSDHAHVKITANIGLWVKGLAPVRAGVPDKEDIWSAHWRVRIGEISPERGDTWWSAATSDEATTAGREMAELLVDWAVPALEKVSSRGALASLWRSGSSPGLTAVQRERHLRSLGAAAG